MRIFLAAVLSIVAIACSSSQKQDEPQKTETEAAATPEPGRVTEPVEVAPGPDLSTPDKAIHQALLAARMENEEEAFQAYLAVCHPDVQQDELAVATLRTEQWQRFRTQCDWYVRAESKADFIRLSKTDPEQITDDTTEIRVFVRDLVHKDNVPAEIVLRRHGNEWRIVSNSM